MITIEMSEVLKLEHPISKTSRQFSNPKVFVVL
jgi:hypothetical protein